MPTILESNGLRFLHFGTPAVQGAMYIARPDDIVLEYVEQMMAWLLFRDQVDHIVQLGLGAGSLTKFCYRRLPEARVTAVELNPDVIAVCREQFALPPEDDRLTVLNMDALDFVSDFSRRRSVDILQVDVYDAQAHEPALGSEAFYAACANCLTRDGIMMVNLYCDWPEHVRHIHRMQAVFDAVAWLPAVHESNIVAMAFKRSPSVDFDELRERATDIRQALGLPAPEWVNGLLSWMAGELEMPVLPAL